MNETSIRVLLIDDHRSVLWGLEKLIDSQRPRMQVIGKYTSFAEASSFIKELAPDIVLLDMDLGTEKGIEVIPQMLAITPAKIVILTGSRDGKLLDHAVVAGAKGVLGKENSAETIIRAIECVHGGQLWIDHDRMGRIISDLSNKKSEKESSPELEKLKTLTPKERMILEAMTSRAGSSGSEVAKSIHISESTLRNHLTSIYAKLDISNRLELWDFAQKYGLNKSSGER
jgi:two-component system, NarL family, nitrate/nitrite response regulator NarL